MYLLKKYGSGIQTGQHALQAARTHVKLEWYVDTKYFRQFITIN
jgi:hypothetical protein